MTRCAAAVRMRTDGTNDHVLIPLDSATIADILGGPVALIETDFERALVAGTGTELPENHTAGEVAHLYGLDRKLHGDVLIFGYDGERLTDAPGAAIMLGMDAQPLAA